MKKLIIMAIIFITSLCGNCFTEINQIEIDNNANEKIVEKTDEKSEIVEIENKANEEKEDELKIDEEKEIEVIQEQVVEYSSSESKKSNSNVSKKQESNKKATSNVKKENESTPKQETEKHEENPKEVVIKQEMEKENVIQEKQEIIKQEEKPKENTPKQEEKIYCVDGGKIHIAGDGANEHGYYKTWDEAFNAFEEYTKDWDTCHYKINQCFCGLYYFWATK